MRFVNLPDPEQDWEGFAGVRVSGRILRTVIPIDLIWGADVSVGTQERVPIGVSLGAGYQQSWTINLRFAYDVRHTEPLLEGVLTVPLFALGAKKAPPCQPPNFGSPRSLAGRIRMQAATLSRMIEPDNSSLPDALPPSVTDLDSFAAAMQGHVPATALDRSHLERLIRTAGGDPGEHDDRDTAQLILDGWRARITLKNCEQP